MCSPSGRSYSKELIELAEQIIGVLSASVYDMIC